MTCTSISWASPKYLCWTLQWGVVTKMEDKTTNLTTYNGPKQNWIFWYPTTNNISWLFLSLSWHRRLLPAFSNLQHNHLMHTQIGKIVIESRIYTLHPLEWPKTISYLTPMHIIKNQESIEVWSLRLELSRFTRSIEPLTHSPLNATMQRASTLLIWKPKT
jgi:hypothetical protein